MQQPIKRKFQDYKVDLIFLVSQNRLLSKTEYESKSLPQSYSRYLELFYQRRLIAIFSEFKNRTWFIDRYFKEEPVTRPDSYSSPRFIVIEDIDQTMPYSLIKDTFANNQEILDIFIDQQDYEHKYTRNVYLNIKNTTDAEELISSLCFSSKAYSMEIKNEIKEFYQLPLNNAQNILEELCKQDNVNVKDVYDTFIKDNNLENGESIETYVKILRNKFRFCTFCVKQYDSVASMHRYCSLHLNMTHCSRNVEILATPRNLNNIDYINEEMELAKHYSKTPDNTFKCNVCTKLFGGMEYIKQHLSTKHPDLIAETQKKKESFEKFTKNIDFYILDIVNGTEYKNTPDYAEVNVEDTAVIYDFPHLFSGEIKLDD